VVVKYIAVFVACGVALYYCSCDCWRSSGSKKRVAASTQIASFQTALGTYLQDTGHFPSTAEGLEALRTNPGDPKWNGPYVPRDIPRDPWGVPYVYKYPGDHGFGPDIVSYGADRQPGGEGMSADIVSWGNR
jgi:general secretion pathway protein G